MRVRCTLNGVIVPDGQPAGDQVADVPLGQFIEDIKQEIENKVTEPSLVPVRKEN